jgi:hypothetical protein
MKAKCIGDVSYFTEGKVYDVDHIDKDGDVWAIDDMGDLFFLYPYECELIEE